MLQRQQTQRKTSLREYPPSWGHLFGLKTLQDPNCEPDFLQISMLNEAVLVTPGVDVRRLKKAFSALVAAHESLRMRFSKRKNEYKIFIMDEHPFGLIVEDHGDVSDEQFHCVVQNYAAATFDLDARVFFEGRVLRFGNRGDVLFIKVSHMFCDGHSMAILFEQLMTSLLLPFNKLKKGVSYEAFLKLYGPNGTALPPNSEAYWRDHLFPVIDLPTMGRTKRGIQPNLELKDSGPLRCLKVSLTEKDSAKFQDTCRQSGVSAYSAMTAAFTATVMKTAKCPQMYCSNTIGRTDSRLHNYVGNHVFMSYLRCEHAPGSSVFDDARSLQEQMTRNLSHLPSPTGIILHGLHDEIVRKGGYLNQFAVRMLLPEGTIRNSPYASSFDVEVGTVRKLGPLAISRLQLDVSPNSLSELTAVLINNQKQLSFEINYDNCAYDTVEIESFVDHFCNRLEIASTTNAHG